MSALDLSDQRRGALAVRVEDMQRSLGRIRYGSVFTIGAARVVLNPESPLPGTNVAATVRGSPGALDATLARLPEVWDEAGVGDVVLLDSPSCSPDVGAVAEEHGYEATEER